MAFLNFSRSRPWRVERLRHEGHQPWYEALKSRRVLWQLGILAAFLVAALLITQVPHPPLPYHKGMPAVHPILARVDFDYVDHQVTLAVKELTALLRVPGLYSPDARQVIALRESLLALAGETAKAESFEKAPEASRQAWKLTPEMFAALKKALGDKGANLPAVQEALTKATAALADPLNLPVVREEDYQRAMTRISQIKDLRNKLPAGLSPDTVPILEEPAATLVVMLPEGDQAIPLRSVMMLTQTDSIQARIERFIEEPLQPIVGAAGVPALAGVLASQIGPTLVYDQPKTENRRKDVRESVEDVRVLRKANTILVETGKEITDADLKILEQEQAARLMQLGWLRATMAWVGAGAVLALLVFLAVLYTVRFQSSAARSIPRSLMLVLLALLVLGLSKAITQVEGAAAGPMALYLLLLATTGMVATIAYGETFALALVGILTLLVAVATRADLDWAMTAVAGSTMAVLTLGEINNRSKLIKIGALAGLTFFLASGALAFWRLDYATTAPWGVVTALLWPAFLDLCAGLLAGIVVLAILPFIERAFGIVTNISLLEQCDVNQPALKRLALEAPGTYTHSLLIGSLAEAAAEAIGANGLLARVGAYFHDIGKASKPRYFIENYQEGPEAHRGLAPTMSRLVIMSHVKDGLEMADRLGLPPAIKQFIAEHHGTTLTEYFYAQARQQAEAAGGPAPDEADYRYPGPKPRSRETAIVMLADAVEGVTRSLRERTAPRINAAVHDMILKRLLDGQLDRCDLTLNDLHKIEETLTKTLLSVYHGRRPYPSENGSGEAAEAPGPGAGPASSRNRKDVSRSGPETLEVEPP